MHGRRRQQHALASQRRRACTRLCLLATCGRASVRGTGPLARHAVLCYLLHMRPGLTLLNKQPLLVQQARATLQLASHVSPASLDGLAEFSHCWVLYVFHANTDLDTRLGTQSTAKVAPGKVHVPRLNGAKRGVLATRSPHRPCPLGLSVGRVLAVDGRSITFGGLDVVDGTPVLDVKPYLPFCDAVHQATAPHWAQVRVCVCLHSPLPRVIHACYVVLPIGRSARWGGATGCGERRLCAWGAGGGGGGVGGVPERGQGVPLRHSCRVLGARRGGTLPRHPVRPPAPAPCWGLRRGGEGLLAGGAGRRECGLQPGRCHRAQVDHHRRACAGAGFVMDGLWNYTHMCAVLSASHLNRCSWRACRLTTGQPGLRAPPPRRRTGRRACRPRRWAPATPRRRGRPAGRRRRGRRRGG